MSKDIVLLPTYFRPEYLQICLEHLSQARGIETKQIWILQDNHVNDQHRHKAEEQWTQEVLAAWRPYRAMDIKFIRINEHCAVGNSRNVLEGYRRAYNTDARMVYQIEDDVFVTPDFFEWHEAVQADGNYFCSVAYNCKYKRPDILVSDDSAAYYTAKWYGSYGVGWQREKLAKILIHATDEYYYNMPSYIEKHLIHTPLGRQFTEQDGLIERVMWLSSLSVAFPYVNRAYHLGFWGYHRSGPRPNGFLEEKLRGLRQLLADPATYTNPTCNPYGDIVPYPSEFPGKFERLTKLQEFQ